MRTPPDDDELRPKPPRPADDGPLFGFDAGVVASERAARKWSGFEKEQVRQVIHATCRDRMTFTAAHIWTALGESFPVTKGLTALLVEASRAGWCVATNKTVRCERGGPHDHGQRLTVWRSLRYSHRGVP